MLLNRLMEKYYVLNEQFTADQWAEYIVEKIHASGKRIEIVESFQHGSESTMRQLATERITQHPIHFYDSKPDFITITMRPFFLKEEHFSFIYSYELSDLIIHQLKNDWRTKFIEDGILMPEYFVIYGEERPEVLYTHNAGETILLIGGNENAGEYLLAKSKGLKLEELNININDLIN